MSLTIDDDAVQRIADEMKGEAYTVTALNLVEAMNDDALILPPPTVASTTALDPPSMSVDTIQKLLDIRRQIVDSGGHLMSTTELDDEVAERKRHPEN